MRQSGKINVEGIKRCRVNIIIKIKCLHCDNIMEANLNEQYLSYPVVGTQDWKYFYCNKCNAEFNLPIVIIGAKLEIEYDTNNLIEDE